MFHGGAGLSDILGELSHLAHAWRRHCLRLANDHLRPLSLGGCQRLLTCSPTSRRSLLEVVKANRSQEGCRCGTEFFLRTDLVGKKLLAVFCRCTTGRQLVDVVFDRFIDRQHWYRVQEAREDRGKDG